MRNLHEVLNDKSFLKYKKELNFEEFSLVGYYPYEIKRIKGIKVSKELYSSILNKMYEENYTKDNKVVMVFKDNINFGTSNFAIFFHDLGAIIGNIKDIINY